MTKAIGVFLCFEWGLSFIGADGPQFRGLDKNSKVVYFKLFSAKLDGRDVVLNKPIQDEDYDRWPVIMIVNKEGDNTVLVSKECLNEFKDGRASIDSIAKHVKLKADIGIEK